ncbi:predicted protein [Lichtheimia corymbifera JMRC:FSU:9682]|uniref:Uncharacterized protein n=1 Tax=Lichtheimia corymbifera JMRC:FSU:9682 TaxID=1263082 RepID=A0A068S1B2_9FUNG|nr:predicted protein [Lichtheimia corymbifera JMRC:FSU:9682]
MSPFLSYDALTAAMPFIVQPQVGEQLVIDDSFRLQTFNNKYARDLSMTQAPFPIQRFSVLSYIQDLIGASRVLIHGCHTRRGLNSSLHYCSGLNMFDVGASDSTSNIAIVARQHHFMQPLRAPLFSGTPLKDILHRCPLIYQVYECCSVWGDTMSAIKYTTIQAIFTWLSWPWMEKEAHQQRSLGSFNQHIGLAMVMLMDGCNQMQ